MVILGREVCIGEVDFVFGHSQAGCGRKQTKAVQGSPRVPALSYDILVTMEEGQFGDGGSYVSFALGRTGCTLAHPAPLSS